MHAQSGYDGDVSTCNENCRSGILYVHFEGAAYVYVSSLKSSRYSDFLPYPIYPGAEWCEHLDLSNMSNFSALWLAGLKFISLFSCRIFGSGYDRSEILLLKILIGSHPGLESHGVVPERSNPFRRTTRAGRSQMHPFQHCWLPISIPCLQECRIRPSYSNHRFMFTLVPAAYKSHGWIQILQFGSV